MNPDDWITDIRRAPHPDLAQAWDSILVGSAVKDRLMNHAVLALRLRGELRFETTSLHGLLLLYGSPGTGKTTLARGVVQELAPLVGGSARLIEVNPHGLMSAEHGQSQQHVVDLLCERIPQYADDGIPTIVLLDEVESMAVARSAASLSANPADVHRATDAVLTALDRNARAHPHVLTIATSNFTEALDEAFLSRADVAIEVPLPDLAGIRAILERTLIEFAERYPQLRLLADGQQLTPVAHALVGLDGRRVRKAITEALALRRETVLDPNRLRPQDLLAAAHRLQASEEAEITRAAA